ncbi:Homeobox protein 4 [Paramyrothecium foliicola]|nr:Homeobox protein 4 [Paramyrothecium foliicola]
MGDLPANHEPFATLRDDQLIPISPTPFDWDADNAMPVSEQIAAQSRGPPQAGSHDIDWRAGEQVMSSFEPSDPVQLPVVASEASAVPPNPQQPQQPKAGARFTVSVVKALRLWFENHEKHPFPSANDIQSLQAQTGLEKKQILNWFANTRRRSRPQAFRSSSPVPWTSHDRSTGPVDIPPRRPTPIPFQNMHPMERWEQSPPEHEGAALLDISRAVATYPANDLRQTSSRNSIDSSANGSMVSGDATSCSSRDFHSDSSAHSFSSHSVVGNPDLIKKPNHRRRRRRLAKRAGSYMTKLKQQLDVFQCTFCTETFKTKYDWQRHEKSLHLPIEEWTCCREDSAVQSTEKGLICILCGEADPDEPHLRAHNAAECLTRPREERTFYRKDHLRQHLKLVHGATYVDPLMKAWKVINDEIKSRCGFCDAVMISWSSRIHHLANHFEKGCTMATWSGDWGFDEEIEEMVENAMPPYLIYLEQMSPLPFSPLKGSVETPVNPYELLGVEIEYYIQDYLDKEDRLPSDLELRYEACSVIFAADVFSCMPVSLAPSWLRDVIMSSDEIASRARLRPITHHKTCVSQLTINGKGNIFEHCAMELELRAFLTMHRAAGHSLSDHEVRQEALNIVTRTHALLTNDFKRFMNFIGRMIWDSDRWVSLVRERAERLQIDQVNNGQREAIPGNSVSASAGLPEPNKLFLPGAFIGEGYFKGSDELPGPALIHNVDVGNFVNPADLEVSGEVPNPLETSMSALHNAANKDWVSSDIWASTGSSPMFSSITPPIVPSPNSSLLATGQASAQTSTSPPLLAASSTVGTHETFHDTYRHTTGWSKQKYFHNSPNSYWALFKDLTRYVQRTMSHHNPDRHVPTDEELKYQARWIWCGDGDPWNFTPADNDQWLQEFKRKAGSQNTETNESKRTVPISMSNDKIHEQFLANKTDESVCAVSTSSQCETRHSNESEKVLPFSNLENGRVDATHVITTSGPPAVDDEHSRNFNSPTESEKAFGWLSTLSLICFALAFTSMMLATILLYYFSEQYHGLGSPKHELYYAWKYGPTTFPLILNVLWGQVDHVVKVSMPWEELGKGPSSAEKTLLLDYVFPLLPVSLWKSFRNRHWVVVLTILGRVLIQVTTVLSTGLLTLEPTWFMEERADFLLRSELQEITRETLAYSPILPITTYIGTQVYGRDYRSGTSSNIAVPIVEPPKIASGDHNYRVVVEGLKIEMTCEALSLTNGTKRPSFEELSSGGGPWWTADISAPGCEIKNATIAKIKDLRVSSTATQNYEMTLGQYRCYAPPEDGFSDINECRNAANCTGSLHHKPEHLRDPRLLFSVADVRFSPYATRPFSPPEHAYIHKLTAILCKPSYSVNTFEVTPPSGSDRLQQSVRSFGHGQDAKKFEHFDDLDLAVAGVHLAEQFYKDFSSMYSLFSESLHPFFHLMLIASKNRDLGDFLDPDFLADTASNMFTGIVTQFLHEAAFKPINKNATGSIDVRTDRLKVSLASTISMSILLSMLALIALATICVRPSSTTTVRSHSAASIAVLLASSPSLNQIMSQMRVLSDAFVRDFLGNFKYRCIKLTEAHEIIDIEPVSIPASTGNEANFKETGKLSWWHPVAATHGFKALIIGFPLAIIAALEVIQHLSERSIGILELSPRSIPVFTTYTPAMIFMTLAGLYSCLQSTATVLAPFVALKNGHATFSRSIGATFLGKTTPHAIFLSLREGHFLLTITLLASFLGGFLTIVASGLYNSIEITETHMITVAEKYTFNFDFTPPPENDKAIAVSILLEYLDLDLGVNAYDNLAFFLPGGYHEGLIESNNKATLLRAKVRALRPRLNCTTLDANDITVTEFVEKTPHQFDDYTMASFSVSLDPQDWCESLPASNGTHSNITWSQILLVPENGTPIYFGETINLSWKQERTSSPWDYDSPRESHTSAGHGCPSVLVKLGQIRKSDIAAQPGITGSSFESDVGVVICYQNIEQVEADVTLSLPSLELDLYRPPQINRSSAKLLTHRNDSKRFDFQLGPWLNQVIDPASQREMLAFNQSLIGSDLKHDAFITSLVQGSDGHYIENILGKDNSVGLIEAANAVYGRYIARTLNLNSRVAVSEADDPAIIKGTVTVGGLEKLMQSRESKIALQVMLSVMVTCGVATTLLLPMRKILHHSPCSIFGIAILLAGSDLVNHELATQLGEGSGADEDVCVSRGLERRTYSLKWRQGALDAAGESREYGIDIDPEPRRD